MSQAVTYERFTDRARKVMQYANQESSRLSDDYIGVEHILLGLIKEGSGLAASVLKALGLSLEALRVQVEATKPPPTEGKQIVIGRLPHSPRAKVTVEQAIREADARGDSHVGTEHLLLALLRETEGPAYQALQAFELSPEKVTAEIEAMLGTTVSPLDEVAEELRMLKHIQRLLHDSALDAHLLFWDDNADDPLTTEVLLSLGFRRDRVWLLLGDDPHPALRTVELDLQSWGLEYFDGDRYQPLPKFLTRTRRDMMYLFHKLGLPCPKIPTENASQ